MPDEDDPFLWLEEVEGGASLAWVRAQNARSLAALESDPRYPGLHEAALAIATAQDRIAYPHFLGTGIANFWQDDRQVRGLWRRASLEAFAADRPEWEPVLDLDALAAAEARNWVYQGGTTLAPEDRLCLIALSDGGKDASEWREFDITAKSFVEGGFVLPEGKQSATWLDADTLLVAREWGAGTLTASGYPFILKRWRRGAPLEAAEEVFRGTPDDVSVRASVLRDADGELRGVLLTRAVDFFESQRYLLTEGGPVRLALPARSSFQSFVSGQLVFSLEEAWHGISAGALVSLDLAACLARADALNPLPIYAPGPREAAENVAATRSRLVVTIYRNVRGSAVCYRFADGAWEPQPLALPDNASILCRVGQRPRRPGFSRCRELSAAEHAVPRRFGRRRHGPSQIGAGALRRLRGSCRAMGSDIAGRDDGAVFRRPPSRPSVRRIVPDRALRLWRVRGVDDPELCGDRRAAVDRARRRLRHRQHPWRRGIRAELASGGAEGQSAARL